MIRHDMIDMVDRQAIKHNRASIGKSMITMVQVAVSMVHSYIPTHLAV